MHTQLIELLSVDLQCSGFTADARNSLLSSDARDALITGVRSPAKRELFTHLEEAAGPQRQRLQLMRLFTVGETLTTEAVNEALPDLHTERACELGLISEVELGAYRATLSLNPYTPVARDAEASDQHWWIISDLDDHLRNRVARPDHVMGVGGATHSLINAIGNQEVDAACELGTGCGVVAMHLAQSCGRVIATDISTRALYFAGLNAQLNQIDNIEFRQGNLFEPVEGEQFDLIVSNPPFVITPEQSEQAHYTYRSAAGAGDSLLQQMLTEAPDHLSESGMMKCLGNWESRWGENGMQRVLSWITEGRQHRISAWIMRRDHQTPLEYAQLWLRDGGIKPEDQEYERLLTEWLNDFCARRVTKIEFGYISVYRNEAEPAVSRTESVLGLIAPDQRFGNTWDQHFANARKITQLSDRDLMKQRLVVEEHVREVREMIPGTDNIISITLTTDTGIERNLQTDTLIAGAVGACDGELTLDEITDALATLFEVDYTEVATHIVQGVRELVWLGMLAPLER